MKIHFLGTGTSTGIPQIGCDCKACRSTDPCDNRMRASAYITLDNGKNILIDCGPDFRQQILQAGAPSLEALIITHSHYDHVGGIDDLRPYCKNDRHFPTFCKADVADDLRHRNPWSFAENLYPGVPTFAITEIEPFKPFNVGHTEMLPVEVIHGKLPILGYRIGNLAYITDASQLPDRTIKALKGVDTLVLNALRHDVHPSHFSLKEAIATATLINARRTLFTHISHDMGCSAEISLPASMHFAHDGLVLNIDND